MGDRAGSSSCEAAGVYPIRCCDDFLRLAEPGSKSLVELDGVKININHVKSYFPKKFFPIEDEDALIGRVFAALLWGKQAHKYEAELEKSTKEME